MSFAAEASINHLLDRMNEHVDELCQPRHKDLIILETVLTRLIVSLFILPRWQQLHKNEHGVKPKPPPLKRLREDQQINDNNNKQIHEHFCL